MQKASSGEWYRKGRNQKNDKKTKLPYVIYGENLTADQIRNNELNRKIQRDAEIESIKKAEKKWIENDYTPEEIYFMPEWKRIRLMKKINEEWLKENEEDEFPIDVDEMNFDTDKVVEEYKKDVRNIDGNNLFQERRNEHNDGEEIVNSKLKSPSTEVLQRQYNMYFNRLLLDMLIKEWKVHDVDIYEPFVYDNGTILPGSGSLVLINNGITAQERTSFTVIVKKIELNLLINCSEYLESELEVSPISRLLLIIDTQASTLPGSVSDILSGADIFAYINPNERKRYVIMYDRTMVHNITSRIGLISTIQGNAALPGTVGNVYGNTSTSSVTATRKQWMINKVFEEDEAVVYRKDTPTALDLSKTNFFLLAFGYKNQATASVYPVSVEGRVRITFKDN